MGILPVGAYALFAKVFDDEPTAKKLLRLLISAQYFVRNNIPLLTLKFSKELFKKHRIGVRFDSSCDVL
jgi:hypothetical protein